MKDGVRGGYILLKVWNCLTCLGVWLLLSDLVSASCLAVCTDSKEKVKGEILNRLVASLCMESEWEVARVWVERYINTQLWDNWDGVLKISQISISLCVVVFCVGWSSRRILSFRRWEYKVSVWDLCGLGLFRWKRWVERVDLMALFYFCCQQRRVGISLLLQNLLSTQHILST